MAQGPQGPGLLVLPGLNLGQGLQGIGEGKGGGPWGLIAQTFRAWGDTGLKSQGAGDLGGG